MMMMIGRGRGEYLGESERERLWRQRSANYLIVKIVREEQILIKTQKKKPLCGGEAEISVARFPHQLPRGIAPKPQGPLPHASAVLQRCQSQLHAVCLL